MCGVMENSKKKKKRKQQQCLDFESMYRYVMFKNIKERIP